MKNIMRFLSLILVIIMLFSSLSVNMFAKAVAEGEKVEEEITDTEIAQVPSTVTERGMQFKIDNLEDVKTIRYAYGEYETEKDIKYGEMAVSHSAKILRKRGDSCTLQFPKVGLVSIVIIYNDGSRDFYKYEVIKSSPTVSRDGGNDITFGELSDLKVIRYAKGEFENSNQIKNAANSVAVRGKNINSDTYTVTLERETYTFCIQYNDESYNYYVTGICGDNLTWVYDMQSATLTISGEGEMYDYYYKTTPWVKYASELKTAILENGITKIGEDAFCACEKLNKIDFPTTLKEIVAGAVNSCYSLESVVIPDSVEKIGQASFSSCKKLKSLIIGDGLTVIDHYAFMNCVSLTDVEFGNNIKFIRSQAFYSCSSLYNIDLPDSVIEIDELAFSGTAYSGDSDNWDDGILYLDGHLIDSREPYTRENVFVKEGTKTIASWAFYDSYIDYVYIPESVIGIYETFNPRSKPILVVYENSYAHEYANKYKFNYRIITSNE